ncbi:OmpH family outer membrane protein [Alkaliflexus imshenetskii]|uniref:OmpH family outer membrane protein n=1 Tax=Alkaliflexus imshenetskii TaxID=286730 RepID=UPI00047EF242|nr:OmpH family outer membrane protein [Alkaliflexus imshenetskii]
MKKTILILLGVLSLQFATVAQRYAFVDTEYVLRNIPAYQAAQEQLNQQSQRWQQEIEAIYQEVSRMYKNYQTESVFLSNEMRISREETIIEKEKEAKLLQHKYFGPEGEMSKRQQNLIQPIQDQVAAVIREIARAEDLAAIFDKSSGILYLDPRHDKSDQVLERLGHRR